MKASSFLQGRKDGRKEENYIGEMEITDLELNDNRGSATIVEKMTEMMDKAALRQWLSQKKTYTGGRGASSSTPFCTNSQQSHRELFIIAEAEMSILLLR